MKTNFKKVCAGMMAVAMIGTMSAAVFADDQPATPEDQKKNASFTFGNPEGGSMVSTTVSVDENGNILDQDGNIVGNIKDLPEIPGVKGAVEAEESKSVSISDENGNIFDENGNLVGNVNDMPVPEDTSSFNIKFEKTDGRGEGSNKASISITDQDGNILDETGKVIGNMKDLPEPGDISGLDVKFDKEEGEAQDGKDGKTVYGVSSMFANEDGVVENGDPSVADVAKSIIIDEKGNIMDEDGNVIGSLKEVKPQ